MNNTMNNLKKLGLVTALALVLTACSKKENTTAETQAQPVAQASAPAPIAPTQPNEPKRTADGKMIVRVATDMNYIPFVGRSAENMSVAEGIDIDILKAIAEKQGFEVEFILYPWEAIFSAFDKGEADMITNGVVLDDFASPNAVPSISYFYSVDCVAGLNAEKLKDWKNSIVTVDGKESLADDMKTVYKIPNSNLVLTKSIYHGLMTVLDNKADVVAGDCSVIRHQANHSKNVVARLNKDPNNKLEFLVEELPQNTDENNASLVFAIHKDNPELLQKINQGITQLKESGELDKIIKKWL